MVRRSKEGRATFRRGSCVAVSKEADMSTEPESHRAPGASLDQSADRGFRIARRSFVFFGALFVAGCATNRTSQIASSRLPSPDWPPIPGPGPATPAVPEAPEMPQGAYCRPPQVDPKTGETKAPEICYGGPVPFARPRSSWAHGAPNTAEMKPMLPAKYITIHHDGMTPFWGLTEIEAKQRLELIRNGHRGKGWSDIGYHYIVDRSGNVWQGRDVTKWQGAHVYERNENNVGVMCMGNFVEQRPSDAQVEALNRTVAQLRGYYRIPAGNVFTHREWPGAQTACPGDNLQSKVRLLRKSGFKSSAVA